jgi:isoamylase
VNEPAIQPGEPHPLGATCDGEGTNFALYSRVAERVELCLFDAGAPQERLRVDVPHRTGHVWHVYVPGCAPGMLYGYRVHGPYEPAAGARCNPAKLLDPYARGIVGEFKWSNALYAYPHDAPEQDLARRATASGRRASTPASPTDVRARARSSPATPSPSQAVR